MIVSPYSFQTSILEYFLFVHYFHVIISFYYLYEYANQSITIWYNYDTKKYIIVL